MAFLLDTNIVSETVKPKPEERVLEWLAAQKPDELYLAAQSLGELVRGARKVNEHNRRERFETWIENDLANQFEGRILPFDSKAATIWGGLMGDGDRKGKTPGAADAQIAAVGISHNLILVTRNIKDFKAFEIDLINPWDETKSQ